MPIATNWSFITSSAATCLSRRTGRSSRLQQQRAYRDELVVHHVFSSNVPIATNWSFITSSAATCLSRRSGRSSRLQQQRAYRDELVVHHVFSSNVPIATKAKTNLSRTATSTPEATGRTTAEHPFEVTERECHIAFIQPILHLKIENSFLTDALPILWPKSAAYFGGCRKIIVLTVFNNIEYDMTL